MEDDIFSKRTGHFSIQEKEITVREDAPQNLRGYIKMVFYELNKKPSQLRNIVCRILKTPPDTDNWSEYPNIDYEVDALLKNCEWFFVYDIIESIITQLSCTEKEKFITNMNEYFVINGIGWKIVNDKIEARGERIFEETVKKAIENLDQVDLKTAKSEIKEALRDLSRRPEPDLTGAVHHSVASLECVVRDVTGDKNSTLGDLMKRYSKIIPTPLDSVVSKIWGFTSEHGRHLREGGVPKYDEVELVVEITSAISTYLVKKNLANKSEMTFEEWWDKHSS